jgi:NitT/TauT family transport system ATP-binding protein
MGFCFRTPKRAPDEDLNPLPDALPKLSVTCVTKRFGPPAQGTLAVCDVTFEVEENEFIVLIGPSGCGKSTLLRMIAGLEIPTAGEMRLDGQSFAGPTRDRGMVFQSYTSFPWLTVQGNIEYGMKLNGIARADRRERASFFLDLVGLTKFKDTFPKNLSGGMKQRVAIARTLANGPSLLLMDEPFGALDAETRWQMQEQLLQIMNRSTTTAIMVTHDVDEAIFLADRIIFMSKHPGRVREIIPNQLKSDRLFSDKSAALELPDFNALRRRILQMMRDEAAKE